VGRLRYTAIASLDGVTVDAQGRFDWAAPAPDVHAWVNDGMRGVAVQVYGRRMYETMRVWQEITGPDDESRDFGELWRNSDKVVVSTTLPAVTTPRTVLERGLDLGGLQVLVAATPGDVTIGGPTLAAAALRAGLVQDLELVVVPWVIGSGLRWLPEGLRLALELVEERRFANGTVGLRYRVG
jgi:dihydrofolate reductase